MPDDHLEALARVEKVGFGVDVLTWTQLYGSDDMLPERHDPRWREKTLARLAALHEARGDEARHVRARYQLRTNYMFALMFILMGTLFLSTMMNVWGADWFGTARDPTLLTAMAAGALGSILSSTYKLRDQAMGIRQLRSFCRRLLPSHSSAQQRRWSST
jgi:hypothetical protein